MRGSVAAACLLAVSVACSAGTLVRAPMDTSGSTAETATAGDGGTAAISTLDAEALVGRWSGQGVQSNSRRWEITLDVAASDGMLTVRVAYPALDCGGEWRLTPIGGREWSGEENLAYGTSTCAGHGYVRVRLVGDALEFDWRESSGGGGVTAHGSLRRTRK